MHDAPIKFKFMAASATSKPLEWFDEFELPFTQHSSFRSFVLSDFYLQFIKDLFVCQLNEHARKETAHTVNLVLCFFVDKFAG